LALNGVWLAVADPEPDEERGHLVALGISSSAFRELPIDYNKLLHPGVIS